MTQTPIVERIEESKCKTCFATCDRLCGMCGCAFCTRHLLSHSSDGCGQYRKIISAILRDDIRDTARQACQVILRAI